MIASILGYYKSQNTSFDDMVWQENRLNKMSTKDIEGEYKTRQLNNVTMLPNAMGWWGYRREVVKHKLGIDND